MMHEPEKSDSVVVAVKPANKAEQSAAEPVEPRTGTKGNANQQRTRRAQDPGKCVTGAGARTARREAREEGEVHFAPAPYQSRDAAGGVLRAEA